MRPALVVLVLTTASLGVPRAAAAQAHRPPTAIARSLADSVALRAAAVAIPDSVRKKVGYQHWKGGAIGGAAGALAGLVLALTVGGACDDCTSNDSDTLEPILLGAGAGGVFGFLVGAASPKYRWVDQGTMD